MAVKYLEILAKGLAAWNKTPLHEWDWRPNLSGADLSGARLVGVCLKRANLHNANLTGAWMQHADLSNANLSNADLNNANLTDPNLIGANLREAVLVRTNLTRAKLSGANLSGALCGWTHFADVDLSAVSGLDYTKHNYTSFIDINTIYRSEGKIPEFFLRGAGVPENLITYMHSLTGAAFDFYSCFISYSTKDQRFADRLYADLQAKGVRCWFAPHDIQGGRKVHEQVDEAIRVYDKLLLILSDASMNSKWVKTEIANARAREEQQKRQMLFPIALVPFERIKAWKLFDADAGTDSAREIREYFIPDFSNWTNHDDYTSAFNRLLRDLKAQPGEKG
jgi:uncharacterized protein YjbI with pentapeptide repeats